MFGFIKQISASAMKFFGCNRSSLNSLNAISLKCVSVNNHECIIRPEIININSNEPLFYPDSIKINKCSGSCNNINYPYSNHVFPILLKT